MQSALETHLMDPMAADPGEGRYIPGPKPPGTPVIAPELTPVTLQLPGNRSLFYLRGGNPAGPVVLFIHGIGGWAEHWLPALEGFEGCRWLLPDLPGFGRSDAPADVTRLGLSAPLWQLLEAEGVREVTLVGNSLGGGLALSMAIERPERISRLVIATAAGINRDIAFSFNLARLPLLGEMLLANRHFLQRLRWRFQFGRTELCSSQFCRDVYDFSSRYDNRPTYLQIVRTGINFRGVVDVLTAHLPSIQQPVLLVWGTKDRVIPFTHAELASRLLPNARFERFEGCGHYPHWEEPERFNHVVREFLAETAPLARADAVGKPVRKL